MKKAILLFTSFLILSNSFALTDKIRLGFVVSPGAGWFSPSGKDLNKGPGGFAMNYGLVVDYYFKDQNYGIQTGFFGGMERGNISGRDTFTSNAGGNVKESYSNQYISIPLYLKLKTNSIKKFHIFGQAGFSLNFTLSSRATFDAPLKYYGADLLIEKENIFKKDNDVTKIIPGFRSNVFDFRISAGAGFEYDLTEKIAVVFGVFYHNGFVNVLADQDSKKDPILVRNLLFTCGVMF